MEESREINQRHIQERLPFEHRKCLVGLEDSIGRWTDIIEDPNSDKKDVMYAISARMQAYRFKAEVLDGGKAIDEVTEFIEQYKDNTNIPQGTTPKNSKVQTDVSTKDA